MTAAEAASGVAELFAGGEEEGEGGGM